jgi:hypothetical protein
MQAVAFENFLENRVIPIPLEYRNSVAKSIKVIVRRLKYLYFFTVAAKIFTCFKNVG